MRRFNGGCSTFTCVNLFIVLSHDVTNPRGYTDYTHTHTQVKCTFSHRQFCYNTVYFSMFDTVVYMYCPAMRLCGVGGVPLDFWVITGEVPPPLSLFYLLVFLGGDSLLHFSSG